MSWSRNTRLVHAAAPVRFENSSVERAAIVESRSMMVRVVPSPPLLNSLSQPAPTILKKARRP
jgi:hypothetical protein